MERLGFIQWGEEGERTPITELWLDMGALMLRFELAPHVYVPPGPFRYRVLGADGAFVLDGLYEEEFLAGKPPGDTWRVTAKCAIGPISGNYARALGGR